jgi:molybdopterin synthase catalytic subunit
MTRQLELIRTNIDEAALLAKRHLSSGMGAAVCFVGVVRATEAGKPIRAIDYEVHEEMARHQFDLIFRQLEKRWPIERVRVIHRVGIVPVNESSLWVEVTAPHRAEAFAACQFLIEELKRVVPIWKNPLP